MIKENMARWHQHLRGDLAGGLDELLDEEVEFLSPVVFTPQKGKMLAKLYLNAAGSTFSDSSPASDSGAEKVAESKFRYVKEVLDGNHAVLEFESELDGKYINGVDIITWNDAGKIIEFKVMIRPLQAVNLLHMKMQAMLEQMSKLQETS